MLMHFNGILDKFDGFPFGLFILSKSEFSYLVRLYLKLLLCLGHFKKEMILRGKHINDY